jgi:hypothetical protein
MSKINTNVATTTTPIKDMMKVTRPEDNPQLIRRLSSQFAIELKGSNITLS